MTKIVSTFSKLNAILEPPHPAGRICAEGGLLDAALSLQRDGLLLPAPRLVARSPRQSCASRRREVPRLLSRGARGDAPVPPLSTPPGSSGLRPAPIPSTGLSAPFQRIGLIPTERLLQPTPGRRSIRAPVVRPNRAPSRFPLPVRVGPGSRPSGSASSRREECGACLAPGRQGSRPPPTTRGGGPAS